MNDSAASELHNEEPSQDSDRKIYGVGCSIDWDSPLKQIAMAVELPFWLLISSSRFNVTVEGISVAVEVDNSGVEIQHGRQFTRTHRNTVFIGSTEAVKHAKIPAGILPDGGIVRGTHTMLYLEAYARQDAVDAFFGDDGPRFQDGSRYMATLAVAQLKVVNAVINAYRRAAVDPFTNEVTAWDLPVWFVVDPPRSQSVSCYSQLTHDWFPTVNSFDGNNERPLIATTPENVSTHLNSDEIPGEIELLDGWSLFHRGRFADSVRSFVTAVEVLLEAEITRIMKSRGAADDEIEKRLAETRTNFEKRMRDYCELSTRRVPGPKLHPVPYVNGIHLLREMTQTRRLRHQIVHHGHRLDQDFEKLMLRAAETTTWLFDWLSDGGGFEDRRRVNSTLFFSLRTTQTLFDTAISNGKIAVQKPDYITPPDPRYFEQLVFGNVIYSEDQYFRTISNAVGLGKDIESFTQMSFFEVGLGEIGDSPYAANDGPTVERFHLDNNGKKLGIYLLDESGALTEGHLMALSNSLDAADKAGDPIRAILVSNDQTQSDWTVRTPLPTTIDQLAISRGISVVTTSELARLVISAVRLKWSRGKIAQAILYGEPGKLSPPASILIGTAYKYWPKCGVIGVIPSEAARQLAIGDTIAIESNKSFVEATVEAIKLDEQGRMTLQVGSTKVELLRESRVFRLDKQQSYQPQEEPAVDLTFPPNSAVATGFVHPSR